MKRICYYALAAINYKNGNATTCPTQSDYAVKFYNLENDYKQMLPSHIYNNPGIIQIRKDLYEGKWPSGCSMCKVIEEESSGKSMRMDYPLTKEHDGKVYDQERFADEIHEVSAFKLYDPKTHIIPPEGLRHIELRFSNACNFSCLHCSTVYSSGWVAKLKKYEPDKEDWEHHLDQLTGVMHRKGPDDIGEISLSIENVDAIIDDLCENFPYLEKIDFAGGEPLYQKQFFHALRKLKKHPNADNIHISFHTNFNANFNITELSDYLSYFRESTIIISIDGGANIYQYFRSGSWEKLVENIDNFKEENDFTWLSSQCTTSVYQVMDIKNIISSFLDLNVDSTDGYIVQSPNYIDPAILMHNFSEDVIKDIDETIHFLKGKVESIKNSNFDPYDAQSDNVKSDYRNSLKPLLGHWDELDLYGKRVFSNLELLGTIKKWMLTHKSPYFDYKRFLVYLKKTDMIWKQNFNDFYPNYKFENKELHRVN